MCTAIAWQNEAFLFGRNLDLEYHYQESVTITPRHFPFRFSNQEYLSDHYAIAGTAYVANGYPLYYDAFNEYGLCMAGLSFPEYASYDHGTACGIAPYELISYLLCTSKTSEEAVERIKCKKIIDKSFSKELPNTPLHWLIADKKKTFVVEPTGGEVKIYENPVGVLTNGPPFPFHMCNLRQYLHLSKNTAISDYWVDGKPFSNGSGAFGLPGDLSSPSRFVRATFTKLNSVEARTYDSGISRFFHTLDSVTQVEGTVAICGQYEKTMYSNCFDPENGIYYFTTYDNRQIRAVYIYGENLSGEDLLSFPMEEKEAIKWINKEPDLV